MEIPDVEDSRIDGIVDDGEAEAEPGCPPDVAVVRGGETSRLLSRLRTEHPGQKKTVASFRTRTGRLQWLHPTKATSAESTLSGSTRCTSAGRNRSTGAAVASIAAPGSSRDAAAVRLRRKRLDGRRGTSCSWTPDDKPPGMLPSDKQALSTTSSWCVLIDASIGGARGTSGAGSLRLRITSNSLRCLIAIRSIESMDWAESCRSSPLPCCGIPASASDRSWVQCRSPSPAPPTPKLTAALESSGDDESLIATK
jgi:hypothetical protein